MMKTFEKQMKELSEKLRDDHKKELRIEREKHNQQLFDLQSEIHQLKTKLLTNNQYSSQIHPMSPPRQANPIELRFDNRGAKRQCDKNTPEKLKRNSGSNP